jgi:hypothetical protein
MIPGISLIRINHPGWPMAKHSALACGTAKRYSLAESYVLPRRNSQHVRDRTSPLYLLDLLECRSQTLLYSASREADEQSRHHHRRG